MYYVCMYVFMYVCMYVCMQVPTYVCMYVCMYACIYLFIYQGTLHLSLCKYVRIDGWMDGLWMHACMYIYVYAYMGKKELSPKNWLCQFLDIKMIYQHAKNQKKLMSCSCK